MDLKLLNVELRVLQEGGPNTIHLTTQDGKGVHYNPKSKSHHQQMPFSCAFKMVVVKKVDSTHPSNGRIYVVCNRDSTIPNEHVR